MLISLMVVSFWGLVRLFLPVKLFFFYGVFGVGLLVVFVLVTKKFWFSLAGALSVVFIGSEYWEIPIFVCGYTFRVGYRFPFWTQHLMIFLLAFLFVVFSGIKINSVVNFMFVLMPPLVTSVFMLLKVDGIVYFIARSFALLVLASLFLCKDLDKTLRKG